MDMLWLSYGAGFTMRVRIPYSVLTGSFGIVFISGAKVQKIIGICKFLNIGNTKMYKNKQTIIPSQIRDKFDVDENTIIEWGVDEFGEPKINFRKKVTLKDVAGMVKKENDVEGDWGIDNGVYLNE